MKLLAGLALFLSSLSILHGCSVNPLTGAPCKGSLQSCPTGQRCAPPGAPEDPWGQCEAPALDLSVSSPVDNAQRTPSTVAITIGACPAFSASAVDLKGDWNVSQLRAATRPGTSAACELSGCESLVIPADGFSARCKLSGTGAECACDVWFDTTDALSATWSRAGEELVLTPPQGTAERCAVAAEGDGLRVRRVAQPGSGAGMQGALMLKVSRAR
ncbi:MAG: hypothetical protein FJ086_08660 [Deltaproteobacteria bacterium]|nr:hypothetical protein [Deltaproteobacteria bacterium]